MSVNARSFAEEEEESAYDATLHSVQTLSSHFSSWEAMIEEDENDSLSSSRVCTVCPDAPARDLLEVWLMAATARHPKAKDGTKTKPDRTTLRRWTRFLGLWISLRLAGLIAGADFADVASVADTRREIEGYEQSFLCVAWPLLMAEQRVRLHQRIAHLRTRCSLVPTDNDAVAQETTGTFTLRDDDSYDSVCRVLCGVAQRASHSVARDYLRITWDVLNPRTTLEAVEGRLPTLFNNPRERQGNGPASLPLVELAAARSVAHTACMVELLEVLQRTQQQHHIADHTDRVWMRVVRTALVHIGYNLVVKTRAAMIDACYFLVPALADFEACVRWCDVMEEEKRRVAAAPNVPECGDAEERMKHDQLQRTVAAFLAATQRFYENTIGEILEGYAKRCVSSSTPPRILTVSAQNVLPPNPLAPLSQTSPAGTQRSFEEATPLQAYEVHGDVASRRQLTVSQPAYALLVAVVEPTCNLLRRYRVRPRGPNHRDASGSAGPHSRPPAAQPRASSKVGAASSSSNDERSSSSACEKFTGFLETTLATCFTKALSAGSSSASSKAEQQAAMDTQVVSTYFVAALKQ